MERCGRGVKRKDLSMDKIKGISRVGRETVRCLTRATTDHTTPCQMPHSAENQQKPFPTHVHSTGTGLGDALNTHNDLMV